MFARDRENRSERPELHNSIHYFPPLNESLLSEAAIHPGKALIHSFGHNRAESLKANDSCSNQDSNKFVNGEPPKESKVKKFLVDTLASVTFAFPVGAMLDLLFTGLSPSQMLNNRGMIAVTNIFTGGLYGKYRDFVFKHFAGTDPSPIRSFVIDTCSNFTFSVPIYVLTSKFAGAPWTGIAKGVLGVALSCLFLSRLYGKYLDMIRRAFGLRGSDEINSPPDQKL